MQEITHTSPFPTFWSVRRCLIVCSWVCAGSLARLRPHTEVHSSRVAHSQIGGSICAWGDFAHGLDWLTNSFRNLVCCATLIDDRLTWIPVLSSILFEEESFGFAILKFRKLSPFANASNFGEWEFISDWEIILLKKSVHMQLQHTSNDIVHRSGPSNLTKSQIKAHSRWKDQDWIKESATN